MEVEVIVAVAVAAAVRMENQAEAHRRSIRRLVTEVVHHLSLHDTIEFFVIVVEKFHG